MNSLGAENQAAVCPSTGQAKLSVCFMIRQLNCGGAQRQLIELIRSLDRKEFEVTLLRFYGGGGLEQEALAISDVRHICLNKIGRWEIFGFLGRLLRVLREIRPDVVHGYLYLANILAVIVAPFLRKRPKIIWGLRSANNHLGHYSRLESLCAATEKLLSAFPDLIISNSRAGLAYALSRGYPLTRTVTIPNGIDSERFVRLPLERERLRTEWKVPSGTLLIGIVGRPVPMKGHRLFLEAAALFLKQYGSAFFVIVGEGSATYTAELRALARELQLESQLVWAGARSDMPSVYSTLDLCTLCSDAVEGFPNVVAEAMACEVPCVVSDAGDSALIVGATGVVVRDRTAQAFAHAWHQCISNDYSGMGRSARARIVANYSVAKLAETSAWAMKDAVG